MRRRLVELERSSANIEAGQITEVRGGTEAYGAAYTVGTEVLATSLRISVTAYQYLV